MIHEAEISSESFVDFTGFSETGAVFIIEVTCARDSRNRQEVISQIGKYAMDSMAIKNILDNEKLFQDKLNEPGLQNKLFSESMYD